MSDLRTRFAARIPDPASQDPPLVPPEIRARYAEAMAQVPRVRLSICPAHLSAGLPAVGSFA